MVILLVRVYHYVLRYLKCVYINKILKYKLRFKFKHKDVA